jgi:hypothetical protein
MIHEDEAGEQAPRDRPHHVGEVKLPDADVDAAIGRNR